MKNLALIIAGLLCYLVAGGQSVLQFRYQDGQRVEGVALAEAANGDIIMVGNYYNAALESDIVVARIGSEGQVIWQYRYGNTSTEYARDIISGADGQFVVAGEVHQGNAEVGDILIFKIDENGNLTWARTYGGAGADLASDILPGKNGTILLAGASNSFGSGNYDFYAINLNAAGELNWAKTYGDTGLQRCFAADTTDTGYILAGVNDGIGQSQRAYACRIDDQGQLLWSKTLDGADDDWLFGVDYRPEEASIVFLGYSSSFGAGQLDNFIYKTDANGQLLWQQTYGSEHIDFLLTATPSADGGYLTSGGEDFYTTKINGDGQLDWYYQYRIRPPESPFRDLPAAIKEWTDGSIVVLGKTRIIEDGATQIYLVRVPGDGSRACLGDDEINVVQIEASAIADSVICFQNSGGESTLLTLERSNSQLTGIDLCHPVGINTTETLSPIALYSVADGFSLNAARPEDLPLTFRVADLAGREIYNGVQSESHQTHFLTHVSKSWHLVYGRSATGRIFSFKWLPF